MSRKAKILKRNVSPDPIFNSKIITKLINAIMKNGKKTIAQKILYKAFDTIKEKTDKEIIKVFDKAIQNITPELEVRSRRIGGSNYQIPVEVIEERKITLALRWLVKYAQLRNEHKMYEKLANEIIDAANGTGATVKKKEDTHKMAEANRAFAHFRW